MLAWFGELNVRERRTMGACFGGWALDAFDVQMYSFVIPTHRTLEANTAAGSVINAGSSMMDTEVGHPVEI